MPPVTPVPYVFLVGESYTRNDIYEIVGVPEDLRGGDWNTGYHRHGDAFFIFASVGVAGQTGHDYGNHFDGDRLVWYGKTGAKISHPSIQTLLQQGQRVYVFYRIQKRGAFVFAGLGRPFRIEKKVVPIRITWVFDVLQESHPERAPGEVRPSEMYSEGTVSRIFVNKYERNPAARKVCIDHWGSRCRVCELDFEKVYGRIGRGYIQVHHLKPLSEIARAYEVDPVADLRPVCPNCHVMLHKASPPIGIEELRQYVLEERDAREARVVRDR